MQQPLQITFRGIDPSPFIEARVRELATRLDRFANRITSCHVTIELPHQHHHQGNHYRVQVELALPGGSVVATRGDTPNQSYEDAHVAIRDTFIAAARQLEERTDRPRALRRTGESESGELHSRR